MMAECYSLVIGLVDELSPHLCSLGTKGRLGCVWISHLPWSWVISLVKYHGGISSKPRRIASRIWPKGPMQRLVKIPSSYSHVDAKS